MTFRWAMSLASQIGIRRSCFSIDCIQLFKRWKKRPDGGSYLVSIASDCRLLSSHFDFVDLSFVRRSDNYVAEFLARHTFFYSDSFWVEDVLF